MNSLVEILNRCGESALQFAWPMLWQSSALIAILFVLDFALRKKVRAAIRYALWLIVLVKLILPPTIASPTNPRWWIHFSNPPAAKVKTSPVTVTYGDSVASPDFQMPLASIPVSPPPQLSRAALILIASGFVSLSLFAWLLFRWRRVAQQICKAEISSDFKLLLDEVRQSTGLHSKIRLKLTDDSMSPAVCGLFRPVILLPQSLAKKLSREQLRAVLLHEAIHLRRGDVWLNCAQALLQIIYWWHPLLWLANARIRRVREEAVDDAVMLALRDESEIYAPTLLEVAQFAFRRPLASLGLVGILESRSALRQRIERLMNFHAPRKAGLTIVSILGILAFTAVALPMGEAPKSNDNSFSSEANSPEEKTLTVKVNPEIFIRNIKAQAANVMDAPTNDYTAILMDILEGEGVDCSPPHDLAFNTKTGEITTENSPEQLEIFRQVIEQLNRTDGKPRLPLGFLPFHRQAVLIESRFYKMSAADFEKVISSLQYYGGQNGGADWWAVLPEQFPQFNDHIKSLGIKGYSAPRIETGHGITADAFSGFAPNNGIDFKCRPIVKNGFVDLNFDLDVMGDFSNGELSRTNRYSKRYEVKGFGSALDRGGFIVRSGPTADDMVAVISLQIVTNDVTRTNWPKSLFKQTKTATNTVSGISADPNFRVVLHALEQRSGVETLAEPEVVTTSGRQVNYSSPNMVHEASYTPTDENDSSSTTMTFKINRPTNDENLKKLLSDAGVKSPTKFFVYARQILIVHGSMEQLALAQGVVLKLNGFSSKEIDEANNRILKQPQLPANPDWDNRLEMRTFKVNAVVFTDALRNNSDLQTTNVSAMAKDFFKKLGIDLSAPGRQIAFNDKLGLLFVKATPSELDAVERAIDALNQVTPQIHIKARFIEVPKGFVMPESFSNVAVNPMIGILSDTNFRAILHAFRQQRGVETLAEPEVVTSSGRQTQMRVTDLMNILTNFTFEETSSNSFIAPQNANFEIGPTIDLVPYVLADGYTINLTAIPELLQFLGYGETNIVFATNSLGEKIQMPTVSPGFRVQESKAVVNLWDGQTLVIGNLKSHFAGFTNGVSTEDEPKFFADAEKKSSTADKEILIFVTATIVDPAGNRVHSDDELQSNPSAIPPQPQQ